VALAAIDALRPLTQQVLGRPSLEGVAVAPFAGMTVVLAAVSITSEHASQMRLGASSVASSEPEATVVAVIDALTKPLRPAMGERPRPSDRRTRFEGLRRQHERLVRLDANAPLPAPRQIMPDEPGEDIDASGEPSAAQIDTVDAPPPPPPEPPPPIEGGHDVISDMSEIRPEPEGGAASMMREEARSEGGGVPAARPMPRASLEDQFYRRLAVTGIKVHIRCRDGHEIPTAVVKDFGPYSLLIEADGLTQLVFKHAIIAIRPYGPLPPEHTVPS
jgi:sRNA-binding regulator protein Hfq